MLRFTEDFNPSCVTTFVASQNDVTKTTIVNCCGKAKISAKDQLNAAEDSDDPFNKLENDLIELRKIYPTLIPQD